MNTLEKHALPARIHLQIRDGVLNELAVFEVTTYGDPIPTEDGAVVDHQTNSCSIIKGLAIAQRNIILESRNQTEGIEKTTLIWLKDLFDWVVAA